MLLRLLKNNRTGGIIFIALLMALAWAGTFIHPLPPLDVPDGMPFYNIIAAGLTGHPLMESFAALSIHLVIAIILVRLNVRFFLIDERSYMPATFYLIVATGNPYMHHVTPVLMGSLFLLITMVILFNAIDDKPDSLRIFNASLVLAAGSMFYLKLAWFIPFIWITISYFRSIRWREVLFPIIAYLLLWLFLYTYYFVFLDETAKLSEMLLENLAMPRHLPDFSMPWIMQTTWLLLLILVASIYIIRSFQSGKIIIRKIYQVLFFLFIYSLLFYFIFDPFNNELIKIAAIPVSYLLANFFHRRKSHWIHEVMLWIWIWTIVYLQLQVYVFI